jgi:membrane-bound ClpP family serine protease
MLMWIIIISLLAIGLGLIILELVFIPGTTVVGILGLIFAIVGVIISYRHFGSAIGFYILMGTLVITGVTLFFSFRSGTWSRFSLKSTIDSKVNEGLVNNLNVGDEGIARSALRPAGTAEFANQNFEVRTTGSFVDTGTRVRITQIQSNTIIVEPLINQI